MASNLKLLLYTLLHTHSHKMNIQPNRATYLNTHKTMNFNLTPKPFVLIDVKYQGQFIRFTIFEGKKIN